MNRRDQEPRFNFTRRLGVLAVGLGLVVALIAWRAFDLQVIQGPKLARLAHQEHHKVVSLTPSRGLIKDRSGEVLAASVQVESIYARPGEIKDVDTTAAKLAELLKTDVRRIKTLLQDSSPFVWLRRQVAPSLAAKVSRAGLAGVGVIPESKRYYPQMELAAHLLGFAGREAEGLEGLEKAYNHYLKGRTSRSVVIRDAKGRGLADPREARTPVGGGDDLILTLDKGVQYLVEQALHRAVSTSGAKGGQALVLEVKTGRVLAMADLPTFNPNIYSHYPKETWRNRSLTDPFEPGSVMKIFTLAAALEEGLFTTRSVINCENGQMSLGGKTIHDVHPHGDISVAEVLRYSSNIGAAKIGLALGAKRLGRNLIRFGFGRKTGFDLPGENPGLVRNPSSWRDIETATISFGQGISVTGLQLTAAIAAVANRGVFMRPFVVSEIRDFNGRVLERFAPTKIGQVMNPRTAAVLKGLMEDVIYDQGGTGSKAAPFGYRAAGKTGTAQKPAKDGRGYSAKNYLALFGGFAPVSNPVIAVLVVVDSPRTSIYGGSVAAPAFAHIVEQALPLLGVPPDNTRLVRDNTAPGSETAGTTARTGGRIDIRPLVIQTGPGSAPATPRPAAVVERRRDAGPVSSLGRPAGRGRAA